MTKPDPMDGVNLMASYAEACGRKIMASAVLVALMIDDDGAVRRSSDAIRAASLFLHQIADLGELVASGCSFTDLWRRLDKLVSAEAGARTEGAS